MSRYIAFFTAAYAYFLASYFIPNGFFYWLCWKVKRDDWAAHRIQKDRDPKPGQVAKEIKSSLTTLLVFAAISTFVFFCFRHGYSSLTTERSILDPSAWGYHAFSIAVLMLLHDTYFYWVHRLMHTKLLYRTVHKEHHDSVAPTPWATYSNTTWEVLMNCALWPLCFTIPVHPAIVISLVQLENIYNTFGHLGFEFSPRWVLRNKWILAIQATPTHHDAHHRYFRGNYSHYFNIWDRLMGTEVKHYAEMCRSAYEVPPRTGGDDAPGREAA